MLSRVAVVSVANLKVYTISGAQPCPRLRACRLSIHRSRVNLLKSADDLLAVGCSGRVRQAGVCLLPSAVLQHDREGQRLPRRSPRPYQPQVRAQQPRSMTRSPPALLSACCANVIGSDGFSGGNLIEGNLLFGSVRETADHGRVPSPPHPSRAAESTCSPLTTCGPLTVDVSRVTER